MRIALISLLASASVCLAVALAQIPTIPLVQVAQFPLPQPRGALAWDGARRVVYCSDTTTQRVLKVGLNDGITQGQITFTNVPERMALSPDGRELLVALLARPHSDTWFDGQWGYLAVIDPDTFVELRRFQVEIDPYDVAVAPGNLVGVSSGSGQWTYVDAYDTTTGARLGSVSGVIREQGRLALHPDGRRLYLSGGEFIQRFNFDPDARTFGRPGDFYAVLSYASAAWVHPNGQVILGSNGGLFRSDEVVTNEFSSLGTLEGGYFSALAFDSFHQAFFTVRGEASSANLCQYHLRTMQLAASGSLGATPWDVFAQAGDLWVAATTNAQQGMLRRFMNPAAGAESNQPPVAALTILPVTPTTLSAITFDASASTDDQGPLALLGCRWDFDGDGRFDTPFTSGLTLSTNFNVPGPRTVVVEVRDRFGETSRATNSFVVVMEEDPGQAVAGHPPFRLPGEAAKVAFDPVRNTLYLTDPAGRRLVFLDLESGLATRQYQFTRTPESLAVTPDGRWLYVALLDAPHNSYRLDYGSGFVAEFDLTRGVKTREFRVTVDPGSLVANDRRQVVVGGGSAQLTHLQSYDASSGELRGFAYVRELAPALLLRSQRRVLASQTHTDGSIMGVYLIDPDTGALTDGSGPNLQSCRGGPLTLNESGTFCATALGSVFGVSAAEAPEGPVRNVEASALALATVFDSDARGMVLAAFPFELRCYNLQTLYLARSVPLAAAPSFLGRKGDRVFAVSVGNGSTSIQVVTTPALGSENNQPPTLRLERSPAQATTRFPVVFDARGTTDDSGGIESVQFRWDLNGDGVYDLPWGSLTVVTQRFLIPGTHRVAVEARDGWGAVSGLQVNVGVTLEADPGEPGMSHAAWRIPFAAADTAFDPARRQVWLSDSAGQMVARVNLDSGLVERQWRFDYPVESLAITPNGRRLYAALLTHPHDYYWRDQLGYVAEFDLETGLQTRVLSFPIDPGDLAATDSGYLFVAGGSGGETSVSCYRVATSQLVGSVPMYNGPTLRVSPSQTKVFAATYWDMNPYLTRFAFDPARGAFGAGPQSPQFGPERDGVGGRVFVLPGEDRLLGGGGAVYRSQPGAADDLRVVADLGLRPVTDVARIPDGGTFAVLSEARLAYFRQDTLERVAQYSLGRPALACAAVQSDLFLVGVANGATWISQRPPPATSPETNQPPTLRWLEPAPGLVSVWPATIRLAVEPDDADGGLDWVQFRENGVVLGVVTNYPFALEVSSLPAGPHTIEAYARDNLGATSAVQTLALRLTLRPEITWLTPVGTTVVDAGANVPLQVSPVDRDGSVAAVRFYVNSAQPGNLLGTVTNAPWLLTVSNLTSTASFVAQVVDNDGVTAETPAALVQVAGPVGDEFYRPFVWTGTNASAVVDSRTATGQLFESTMVGWGPLHTLWWSWTPPVAGRYTLSTRGSSFDTVLGVYTGTDISSLTRVAVNDDDPASPPTSRLKFTAYPGTFYALVVDGYQGATGVVHLTLALDTPLLVAPRNDLFANRVPLVGADLLVEATNAGATSETGEPRHDGTAAGPSVWWEWVAPASGAVRLTTVGSTFDTVLAVYTGVSGSVSALRVLTSNDDDPAGGRTSRVVFFANGATRYALAVSGFAGATGGIRLALQFTPSSGTPPVNDAFAARLPLEGTELTIEGSNSLATAEPGEPPLGFRLPRYTVWWRWRSPGWGPVSLRVQGGAFSPNAAVFTGDALRNLQLVSATTDSTKPGVLSFQAVAGVEYAIAVDSPSTVTGPFFLILRAPELIGPPRLSLAPPWPAGNFVIQCAGYPGGVVTVWSSSNLVEWFPLLTNQLAPGEPIVLETDGQPARFFRARFE